MILKSPEYSDANANETLMDYNQLFTYAQDYLKEGTFLIQALVVLAVALLIDRTQKRILTKLRARSDKTQTYWDDALLEAAAKPLSLLLWVIAITFAVDVAKDESDAVIFTAVDSIRDVGAITAFTWFLVRFVSRVETRMLGARLQAGELFDRTTIDVVAKLLRSSIIVIAFLVVLQTLGFSVSGVLAFGGVGGVVVGFAARDLLANFFGGLMIYLDRPFEVGDWVRSPDKEIEGMVENIGWRLTRIRTFDKRPLYVPNSVFPHIAVENPQRMTNRRIYETIGIRYDDAGKMSIITRDVKQMLRNHPEIDTNLTMIVNFVRFAPSSLDFFVYTFTKTTDWIRFHEIKEDVMLKIIEIIEGQGAECAFPTSTIHIAPQQGADPGSPGPDLGLQQPRVGVSRSYGEF